MDGSAPIASITISYLRERYSEEINADFHGKEQMMSRYVDADVLKANCDIIVGNTTIGRRDYVMFHEIDSAPSIDIVRCKECKKANTEECSHSYWDDDWGEWRVGYRGDNWFCADGEREGE